MIHEYRDSPEHRVLPDPEHTGYEYRCYDMQLQFRYVGDPAYCNGNWYPVDHRCDRVNEPTSARRAVWEDLFVRPLVDSPELP